MRRQDRVVVLGDGRLGNLCAQVLAGLSDHVLVVGKHRSKLALLGAKGIATALLADVTDSRMADIVVDCTGSGHAACPPRCGWCARAARSCSRPPWPARRSWPGRRS